MPDKPLILIVDDEEDVRELVGLNLRRAGFATGEATNGLEALRLAREFKPDAMVLDVMMPGRDGLGVCKELRNDEAFRDMPIIMLTARGLAADRITGLQNGADDYISKPFSPKELVLRVQAVLRRANESRDGPEVDIGPFHFDMLGVRVSTAGSPVALTLLEFKFLHLLASRRGALLERDTIFREVWGYTDLVHSRTLDTHVKRLRRKLGVHAGWIQTVRGLGYIFQDPASAATGGG